MKKIALIILTCLLAPTLALASDYSSYQKEIIKPYGLYKKSLALTSKPKNKEKAIRVVGKYIEAWAAFATTYENDPPAPLAGQPDFAGKINRPTAVGRTALEQLKAGEVYKAHATLEEVRYLLWRMRIEAGVDSLNDKVNDFHEAMEIVLDGMKEDKSPEHLKHLGSRYGAWLAIKWQEVAKWNYTAQDKDVFEEAAAKGAKAIDELRKALANGDHDVADTLGDKMKKQYKAIFFLPACS